MADLATAYEVASRAARVAGTDLAIAAELAILHPAERKNAQKLGGVAGTTLTG